MTHAIVLLRGARGRGRLAGSLACLLLVGCHALSFPYLPAAAPPSSSIVGQLHVVNGGVAGFAGLGPAVVYLEPIGVIPESAPVRAAQVLHAGHGFEPELLAIGPGQPIRLVNESGLYHRVFWLTHGKRVEAELAPAPSSTADLEIEVRGITRFYCDLHPEEHFSVFVASSRHVAVLNSPGPYALEGLPAGAWRLRLWTERVAGPIRSLRVASGEASKQDIWIDARRLPSR